jgi:membrane protein involved in colicin uptake
MKKVYLFCLLLWFCVGLVAQPFTPIINGKVVDEKGALAGAVIRVYQGTKLINTVITSSDGRYIIQLPINGDFVVSISKPELVGKKFLFSTRGITDERAAEKFNPIVIEVEIRKKIGDINYAIYDQPMSKFYFDAPKDKFEFDINYLNQMLKAQDAIFAQEEDYLKREKKYNDAMKLAEKAMEKKDYDAAIKNFTEASKLMPKQQLPIDGIAEATRLKNETEAQMPNNYPVFDGLITNEKGPVANVKIELHQGNKVVNAIESGVDGKYSMQLPINGDFFICIVKEGYITKKFLASTIGITEKRLKQKFIPVFIETKIRKKVVDIDYAMYNQPMSKFYFDVKKDRFEYDLSFQNQMQKNEELVVEQEKIVLIREEKYNKAIENAEKALGKQQYEDAIKYYTEASQIKPNEQKPKDGIVGTNKLYEAEVKSKIKIYQPTINGKISDVNGPIAGATIQVMHGNDIVSTITTGSDGKYNIQLPLNMDLMIVLNNKNFISKKFIVSTKGITEQRTYEKFNPISIETSVRPMIEGMDYSLYNQPMNKIYFDVPKDKFEYDIDYLDQMLRAEDKLIEQEFQFKNNQKKYDEAIAGAEKFFVKKEYERAINQYNEALKFKPKEKFPKDRITEINRLIAEAEAETKAKAEAIKKAEEEAKQKAIDDAKRKAEEEARIKAEQEAKRKAEEEARIKAEQEAKRKAEEEARIKAEQEARRKAEEEARIKAEQEAKRKAEEEARIKAEQEAKHKAEEEARIKAEQEAKRKAEEEARIKAEQEAKRKAEEEARIKAEQEAKRKAEEEARIKAEQEAKRKAEEEARIKAEQEAKRKTEEEARIKAEQEAKRKAEEEARIKAEQEAKRKAEEEARIKAEQEAKRKAEEEARIKAEQEARRKAEEEARIKAEQEAKRKAEEEARIKAEQEAKRKAEEEARIKAEQEAKRKTEEEARIKAEQEARRKAEEEARIKAEQEAKRKAEEEARIKAEEEAKRKAEEEARIKAEEEAKRKTEEEARIKAEQEAKRKAEEEARIKAEQEAKRKAEEEARIKAEEEAKRKAEEEARIKAEEEAKRKAEEEARIKAEQESKRKAEEEARIKAEQEAKRKAEEEARIKAEQEAKRKAEEEARIKAEEEAKRKAEEEARIKAEEEEKKANDKKPTRYISPPLLGGDKSKTTTEKPAHPLCAKYPQGVTEEDVYDKGIHIIKRIVVKDKEAWVYTKKIFKWGGKAFFRDDVPITESTFEMETKKQ